MQLRPVAPDQKRGLRCLQDNSLPPAVGKRMTIQADFLQKLAKASKKGILVATGEGALLLESARLDDGPELEGAALAEAFPSPAT